MVWEKEEHLIIRTLQAFLCGNTTPHVLSLYCYSGWVSYHLTEIIYVVMDETCDYLASLSVGVYQHWFILLLFLLLSSCPFEGSVSDKCCHHFLFLPLQALLCPAIIVVAIPTVFFLLSLMLLPFWALCVLFISRDQTTESLFFETACNSVNVVVKWLPLMSFIRDLLGSNLGMENLNSVCEVLIAFLSLVMQMLG